MNKTEDRGGSTVNHDYTWSPWGLLLDSHESTRYTPGFAQQQNSVDRFFHGD